MTPQQIQLAQDLLVEAKGLNREDREPFLKTACAEDSELLAEVRSLLETDNTDAGASPLDVPAMGDEFSLKNLIGLDQTLSGKFRIGRYHVRELLGEGGMGAVYMAEQRHPIRRVVAIKLIKAGVDTKEVIARFESERRALAQMEHPNIARVIDAGTTSMGRPYFVMEYVPGAPLTRFCASNRLTVPQRLTLFIQACEAISHAHMKATIHRDLKPSNVLAFMLDGKPTVKVIDFGIAKALTSDHISDHTQYTSHGQVLGSYESMSPEQADGSPDVDARTDIYSLGSLLYELLTGCTPLDVRASSDMSRPEDIHRRIRDEEPLPPSARLATLSADSLAHFAQTCRAEPLRLIRAIRGDLDWIVMRCLEKDANRRYRSASDLTADIDRHMNNEPVLARPPSRGYRLRKLVRRNRVKFAAATAVLLAVCLGAAVSTWQAVRAVQAQRREAELRGLAEQQSVRLQRELYIAQMNTAGQAADEEGGIGLTRRILELWDNTNPDLRGWEWHYLHALCNTHHRTIVTSGRSVRDVEWSPDGGRIAAIGTDSFLEVWDPSNETPFLRIDTKERQSLALSWHPEGGRIAIGCSDGSTHILDSGTGKAVMVLTGYGFPTSAVAWSPSGTRLATGAKDGRIRIWNAGNGQEVRSLDVHRSGVVRLAWSPDETRLASAESKSGTIRIWDVATGEECVALVGHYAGGGITGFCWTPDSQRLVSCSTDWSIRVWDVKRGAQVSQVKSGHHTTVDGLAISPDGRQIVTCSHYEWTIRIWDIDAGTEVRALRGHGGPVNSVSWSPDGRWLASGSSDATVMLWDLQSTSPALDVRGHTGTINSIAWSPDGKRLASAAKDSTVRIWDTATFQPLSIFTGHKKAVKAVSWSRDGTGVASAGDDQTICVFDPNDGRELIRIGQHGSEVSAVAWSPDARRLASTGTNGMVKIWDVETGDELLSMRGGGTSLAWSLDGTRIAAGGFSEVQLFDARTGARLFVTHRHVGAVTSVAWSPDGKRLATCGEDGLMIVWNTTDDMGLMQGKTLHGHVGSMRSLSWNLDGSRIASGARGPDFWVRIWDTSEGKQVLALRDWGSVLTVAWSPDGKMLASGGNGGILRVYDARPQEQRNHPDRLRSLANLTDRGVPKDLQPTSKETE